MKECIFDKVIRMLHNVGPEKNKMLWPNRDSNAGPLAYRAESLPLDYRVKCQYRVCKTV